MPETYLPISRSLGRLLMSLLKSFCAWSRAALLSARDASNVFWVAIVERVYALPVCIRFTRTSLSRLSCSVIWRPEVRDIFLVTYKYCKIAGLKGLNDSHNKLVSVAVEICRRLRNRLLEGLADLF
jgi:hypothetical protein